MSTSPEPLSGDDLDLIADYGEGLLDAVQSARVADLIATDERWAITHGLLAASAHRLEQALDAYADATPTLPVDVAGDIDAALHALKGAGPDQNAPTSLAAARRRRESRGAKTRSFSSRAGLSAAAAVIVAICFGLGSIALHSNSNKSATSSSAEGSVAGQLPAPAELKGVTVTRSGVNYTPANLGSKIRNPAGTKTFGRPDAANPQSALPASPLDAELARLAAQPALAACLSAVVASHGGVVTAVDYARYNGRPALIVALSGPDVRVAVGPDCGLPSSGADELATAETR